MSRLPRPLLDFVDLFNREEYWESHEALEDAWRETGSDFYQGLIIYASAFVHARRGNAHGVRAQLEKAEAYLAPYRPTHLGIDVDALFRHAARCRRALEEGEGDGAVDGSEGRSGDGSGGQGGGSGGQGGGSGGQGEPVRGRRAEAGLPVPRIRLEPDPARIAGNEPELQAG